MLPTRRKRKSTSPVYGQYNEVSYNDANGIRQLMYRCKHCPQSYGETTATGNLQSHYDKQHRPTSIIQPLSSEPSNPVSLSAGLTFAGVTSPAVTLAPSSVSSLSPLPSAPTTTFTRQRSLPASFQQPVSSRDVDTAVAIVWARHSLAHYLVELPDVRRMFELYRLAHCPLPNRRQLRDAQRAHATELRTKVVQQMLRFASSFPVSIAVDGWTNNRHEKITNVICLCGGDAFYWCSIVNSHERNTADWLAEPLKAQMLAIRGLGIPIVALVADNEEVNRALYKRLQPAFPSLILAPCGAHTLQLCVKKALDLPGIKEVMLTMAEVIGTFAATKEFRQRLHTLQTAANTPPLVLLRAQDTRWSSHLYAARRLKRLQQWVQHILPQPEAFWTSLSAIIAFLTPFQVSTDVIQADHSTLYTVHQQFEKLLREVDETPASSCFAPLKDVVRDIIKARWKKFMPISAVVQLAILSFDDSGLLQFDSGQITKARSFFADFAVDYLKHHHLSVHDTAEAIRSAFTVQYADFQMRQGTFTTLNGDIIRVRHEQSTATAVGHVRGVNVHMANVSADDVSQATVSHSYWNPKSVWAYHSGSAYELCTAAIALLSVAGSEAAVERSFSAQDIVHSKRRNRLKDDAIEQEVFIRFNSSVLEREGTRPQAHTYIDLSVDSANVDRSDSVRQVTGLFASFADAADEEKKNEDGDVVFDSGPAVVVQIEGALPSPADLCERFIIYFIEKYGLSPGSTVRWRRDMDNVVQAEAIGFEPQVKDTLGELKRRIIAKLRPPHPIAIAAAAAPLVIDR
jgi:hypothetical protein